MSRQVDSSALLKRYLEEPDSGRADELPRDGSLVTARHTVVEVRRTLARLLTGRLLGEARASFDRDLDAFALVELDEASCELAATIAEQTGVRTLDALHLGAAQRAGGQALTVLTFDVRQAQAARSLGFPVLGT